MYNSNITRCLVASADIDILAHADLSRIQNVHDLLQNRNSVILMLLTQHLDVTQLPEVEITFFLERINCLL